MVAGSSPTRLVEVTIGKLSHQFGRSLHYNDKGKKDRVVTLTPPPCQTTNPLRLLPLPYLALVTDFKIRLPENLLSLAQQIMSLTLKVHGLGL